MSVFVAVTLAASLVGAQAEQKAAQEHLKAWAEAFAGDWTSESTVDVETALLKPGDKIVAHWSIEWSPDREALFTKYWADVKGSTFVTVRAVVGWDASEGAVVTHWFSSLGGAGKIVYKQAGDKWAAEWSAVEPDKQRRSWTAHIKFIDRNTQETTNTDRIIKGERKADQTVIAKRR